MNDQRSNEWFADEIDRKCDDAEKHGRNWLHGVIGQDTGYPPEIILTTLDAREISVRLRKL